MALRRTRDAETLGAEYSSKNEYAIAYVIYKYCDQKLVRLLEQADTWMVLFNITRSGDTFFANIYEEIQSSIFSARERLEYLRNIICYEAQNID
jgi:hypothetical protein